MNYVLLSGVSLYSALIGLLFVVTEKQVHSNHDHHHALLLEWY